MQHRYQCANCGDIMESYSLQGLIIKMEIHNDPKSEKHCEFLDAKVS